MSGSNSDPDKNVYNIEDLALQVPKNIVQLEHLMFKFCFKKKHMN